MRTVLFFVLAVVLLSACQKEQKKVTPSGYEYVLHTGGEGAKPAVGDLVYFHAQMRNGDSIVFGSRMNRQTPYLTIADPTMPGYAPSPVEEVLREMGVGDSVTIYVRLDTLPQKPRGFEDTDVMYYDVVLTEIRTREDIAKVQARESEVGEKTRALVQQYATGQLLGELQQTESGLKYLIHEEGTGPQATPGSMVTVHYYGILPDGTMFDNSFRNGEPFPFTLGQGEVIPGWDEGIALLKQGAKATLFIPYTLAYGEAGVPPTIPPQTDLIFYVELEKVEQF